MSWRVTVLGPGGVGGYFGARLAQGGADVTMVARGAHGQAIAQSGLQVRSIHGDFHVTPKVVASLAEAPRCDLLLVGVKMTDLDSATAPLESAELRERLLGTSGVTLATQNGLDAEELLSGKIGSAHPVVGSVCSIGAGISAPGEILHKSLGKMLIGAPGSNSSSAAEVAALLAKHGVDATLASDFWRAKWTKLLWNNAFNSVSALTHRLISEIVDDPTLRNFLRDIMRETKEVALAEGVALPPDIEESLLNVQPEVRAVKTSMLQDVERGRAIERDALVTTVVRRGRKHGVPTPLNELLDRLLEGIERGATLRGESR